MLTRPELSEARRRGWDTRRAKYGQKGHAGSYTRPSGPCTTCDRLMASIIRWHRLGDLSEGQVAKATGLPRIEIRRLADEQTNAEPAPAALIATQEAAHG